MVLIQIIARIIIADEDVPLLVRKSGFDGGLELMSKAFEFLKECGAFFVLTINEDYPADRPFGAAMEVDDYLYLSTNDLNEAHKQLRNNEHIQIVAKKLDSREWIRITGIAAESNDGMLKQQMLEECLFSNSVLGR